MYGTNGMMADGTFNNQRTESNRSMFIPRRKVVGNLPDKENIELNLLSKLKIQIFSVFWMVLFLN